MPSSRSAAVSSVEIDAEILDRAVGLNTGVAVLPMSEKDGKAVYSEASVMLVKELRALGAAAEYLDPSGERLFEVKKSAIESAALSIIFGIASSAAWDAMKTWLMAKPRSRLSITYVELEDSDGRRGHAWHAEGDTIGVVEAIERLRAEAKPQSIDEPDTGTG